MQATRSVGVAMRLAVLGAAFLCAAALPPLAAETGAEAWLRYSALSPQAAKGYQRLPDKTVLLGDSVVLHTAQQELVRGVAQMLGRTLRIGGGSPPDHAIVLAKLTELRALAPLLHPPQDLRADGYWLKTAKIHGSECLIVASITDRAVHLLRRWKRPPRFDPRRPVRPTAGFDWHQRLHG